MGGAALVRKVAGAPLLIDAGDAPVKVAEVPLPTDAAGGAEDTGGGAGRWAVAWLLMALQSAPAIRLLT